MSANLGSLMSKIAWVQDKENIPLTESVTPPSLENLSLEEEANDNENEATLWEDSVAINIIMTPRASSSFLK